MGPLDMQASEPLKVGQSIAPTLAVQAAQSGIDFLGSTLQRKWNQRDYAKQRADALSDWNMQNAYNSPIQQMQRLKEAGLNPNFVYGQGTVANNTQAPRGANLAPSKLDLKAINPMDTMTNYNNLTTQKLQQDNLRKNIEVQEAQRKMIETNTLKASKDIDSKTFALNRDTYFRDNGLWKYQMDYNEAKLNNLNISTGIKVAENVRRELMNAKNLEFVTSRIGQIAMQNTLIPQQRDLIQEQVKKLKNEISYMGINQSQKEDLTQLIMNNWAIKNVLDGKKMDIMDIQKAMQEIKTQAAKEGISTEYTEKLTLSLLNLMTR